MNQTITIRFTEANDTELLVRLGREIFYDAFADNPLMPQEDLRLYLDSAFTISQNRRSSWQRFTAKLSVMQSLNAMQRQKA